MFDVLEVDGESVRALSYTERRDMLDGLELADGRRVQVPPNMVADVLVPGAAAPVRRGSGSWSFQTTLVPVAVPAGFPSNA